MANIEKVMANIDKSQGGKHDRRKLIVITEDKRKKIQILIEEGLKLKKRRSGLTCDEEELPKGDTQSLKKIRLHRPMKNEHVATKSETEEHPPKHEPVTIKLKPKSKCNICIYYGKENFNCHTEYYKCLDCESSPVLCSLNHFDLWHSVAHNWLEIPSTSLNPRPCLQCAICEKVTTFHCPVCKPVIGYCSLHHFKEGHKNL